MPFVSIILLLVAVLVIVAIFRAVRIVKQSTAIIVERLGRFQAAYGAGMHFLVPFIDRVRNIMDLREQVVSFPPQPVITSDNLVVSIDSVVYYQITDPMRATYEISNYLQAIEQLTVTTLRNVVGSMDLEQTLTSRDQINGQLRGQLEDTLNQLQQAQKSQQDMSADMDSRLKRFEPTQVTIDGRQFSVEQAEKNEFEAALALFRKSNFKAADQAFAKFAKTYPESPYLPTALYWQGGAQYAQGNYNGAVNTLQSLIQRFPDSTRKADALLLIGNAQVDAGNDKAARQTFIRIGKEHPNTPAANAARERLKAM